MLYLHYFSFFFFNDPATTEIYTLSLHDALPISSGPARHRDRRHTSRPTTMSPTPRRARCMRSEEHTSELQSRQYLVCRLLLEKKKNIEKQIPNRLAAQYQMTTNHERSDVHTDTP